MQLKSESTHELRKKHHAIKRLVKAAQSAKSLVELLQNMNVEARTLLEAQAYSETMTAYMHFERQQWQLALDHFATSRYYFEKKT